MKATLIGFKAFSGKDGRKWVNMGFAYKDASAIGGNFAQSFIMSDQNGISSQLKAGQKYDVDFDPRGRLIDITPID